MQLSGSSTLQQPLSVPTKASFEREVDNRQNTVQYRVVERSLARVSLVDCQKRGKFCRAFLSLIEIDESRYSSRTENTYLMTGCFSS